MSENMEQPTPKVRIHRSRAKRKFSRARLPTPPPDPKVYEELFEQSENSEETISDKDKEFLEYINALQKSPHLQLARSESLFAPVAATEDAFDHLDKLYKLMEQMLNLRQQNARLQRRVRDLEHLKNLQSIHRQMDNPVIFEDIPELDDDSSLAESLLDSMLSGTKKDTKPKPWTRSRIRQSLMRKQRNRSSSLNDRVASFDTDQAQDQRRASAGSDREKSAKVSKWTKVKAAFRWEKASPSVTGAKSHDSGISGMLPVNYEVARYLRVPSTSEDAGVSPADSGAADGSTPGSLSSASSADDIHRSEHRSGHGSDDDRNSITVNGVHLRKSASSTDSTRPMWVRMKSKTPSSSNAHEKNRLSCRSDDLKMDISDNEDLIQSSHSDKPQVVRQSSRIRAKREIPPTVIARYQEVVAEDERASKQNSSPKRISKWTRVKKAFLTPIPGNSTSCKHKCDGGSSCLSLAACKDSQTRSHETETKRIQDEIQRNYRQLQKKLSLEFQGKLQEWEKLKALGSSNVAGAHSRCDGVPDEQRDQAFMKKMEEWQRIKAQPSKSTQNVPMIREENLAPEFKKKLEEWQRMKKSTVKDDSSPVTKTKKKLGEWPKWKSVSGHREDHAPIENQQLSEEFLKKLEEWRKIKKQDETSPPSPKLIRKQLTEPSTSGQSRKGKEQDHKELHWFETELDKIEKQKQKLEQERHKFLQREERLTKLRRTVLGDGNKKDVLVHTPSGFYRFEGISRKFTQKLCEWEKAQGIGPEASTFALLTSTFTPHIKVDLYEADSPATQCGSSRLLRSKSAESISSPNLIQPGPSSSHHPSSLSLNDVEELEKQCLSLSRCSSAQDIDASLEKFENDEPEAVIVEIEDVEEETASALEESLQEKHFPIYQRELALNTCEKQPSVIPYVQRDESNSSQYCCFLIEDIIQILRAIENDEDTSWEAEYQTLKLEALYGDDNFDDFEQQSPCSPDLLRFKDKTEIQKQRCDAVLEKIIRLQEIHRKNISDLTDDEFAPSSSHFSSLSETVQDLFFELLQTSEQLQNTMCNHYEENSNATYFNFSDSQYSSVPTLTSDLIVKLSELKRILTYFYAASDMTAPGRKLKSIKKLRPEQKEDFPVHLEKIKRCSSTSDIDTLSSSQNKQGQLVAKRMRYKKKDYTSKTLRENEGDTINDIRRKHKGEECEMITVDPVIIEKLVIPTKTNYVNISCAPSPSSIMEVAPADVFVKTTRTFFSPLPDTQVAENPSESPLGSNTDLSTYDQESIPQKENCINDSDQNLAARLPPLPSSPASQRKLSKEISPSIRIMMAKYNQMISKQEAPGNSMSAASSGSASPVAWRSPVSERRVKAQRERYLEEISKISEVKKSASVSILNSDIIPRKPQSGSVSALSNENNLKITKGILRSTSASVIQTAIAAEKLEQSQKHPPLKLIIPENSSELRKHSAELRHSKIQRAKEEFLNSPGTPVPSPISAPPILPDNQGSTLKYPVRSRFSQISMGSESSCDSTPYEGLLVKSASAGMINVDEDTYKQIDPAFHREGYVSLPRSVAKQKEGLLGGKLSLSNIAAKFRKVKMRRSKDQKKMNTVSALCRQSLTVDINSGTQEGSPQERESRSNSLTVPSDRAASSSEDTSPSSSRSGSWIRRSRIFKAL